PLFDNWKSSRDGNLEFGRLPENAYTLEVAYSGSGPSAPLIFPFRVGNPHESISWRWLLGLPLAGCALAVLVRRAPCFRRTNYWLEKTVFLLRCRLRRREVSSPVAAPDRAGEVLFSRYRL